MKDNLLEALPLFVGAVLGVWFYYSTLDPVLCLMVAALLAVAGLLFRTCAATMIGKKPVWAVRLWQLEVLLPVALISVGGYGLTWVIDSLPDLIQKMPLLDLAGGPVVDKAAEDAAISATDAQKAAKAAAEKARADRIAAISATLGTAVTAFLGALFMDDQKDSKGGYWPPAQIRKAMETAFAPEVDKLKSIFNRQPGESDTAFDARLAASGGEIERYNRVSRAIYSEQISNAEPEGWSIAGALVRARILTDHLIVPASKT
jgi:hypothetical protein